MDNYMYLISVLLIKLFTHSPLHKLRSLRVHRLNQVGFFVRLILCGAPSWLRYRIANRVHVFTQEFRRAHFAVFSLLRSMIPGSGIGGFHALILAFVLRHVFIVLARVLMKRASRVDGFHKVQGVRLGSIPRDVCGYMVNFIQNV